MTKELGKELEDMCNLSQYIKEEGILQGRKEGRKQGRRQGRREGRKEGLVEGRKEGIEKGRKEGILVGVKKGKADEKMDIAKKMKAEGFDNALIEKLTGILLH